jgi:hypothetical protein
MTASPISHHVVHDLKEMEGQLWELGKWMTLMATTTAAAGDCNWGTMASEFGKTPTLLSLSWTRTIGVGGGGTRRGSNDNNRRIDNRPPPRMLVGMPMPVVRYPTNSDFPGINLPPLLQDGWADHTGRFNNASYSKCKFLDVVMVLVLWEYPFNDDGGGKTKPAVIVDGETYRVNELRQGAVVPRWQSSSYHPSECAYWMRSKLRGAIYGRVRRGTVLRCLDPPVHVSVNVKESAVVEAGWMSTSIHVAIKEMSWELVGEHRSTLAEDPIKEVAATQYLQDLLETRDDGGDAGGGRRDDKEYLGRGHGGEGPSDPARRPNVIRAGWLSLPGRDHPKATGVAMCE